MNGYVSTAESGGYIVDVLVNINLGQNINISVSSI
jgi:hypothetical protein